MSALSHMSRNVFWLLLSSYLKLSFCSHPLGFDASFYTRVQQACTSGEFRSLPDVHEESLRPMLYRAAYVGHTDVMNMIMRKYKVPNNMQKDLFLYACRRGSHEIVHYLVENCLGNPSTNRWKPVRIAVQHGHYKLLDIFLQHPIHGAGIPAHILTNAFIKACKNGNVKIIKRLINVHQVPPHTHKSKSLRLASEHGHVKVVKLLLRHESVKPHAKKGSALIKACMGGHLDVVQALLSDETHLYLFTPFLSNALLVALQYEQENVALYLLTLYSNPPRLGDSLDMIRLYTMANDMDRFFVQCKNDLALSDAEHTFFFFTAWYHGANKVCRRILGEGSPDFSACHEDLLQILLLDGDFKLIPDALRRGYYQPSLDPKNFLLVHLLKWNNVHGVRMLLRDTDYEFSFSDAFFDMHYHNPHANVDDCTLEIFRLMLAHSIANSRIVLHSDPLRSKCIDFRGLCKREWNDLADSKLPVELLSTFEEYDYAVRCAASHRNLPLFRLVLDAFLKFEQEPSVKLDATLRFCFLDTLEYSLAWLVGSKSLDEATTDCIIYCGEDLEVEGIIGKMIREVEKHGCKHLVKLISACQNSSAMEQLQKIGVADLCQKIYSCLHSFFA